ncbi:MAG: class I SAM-dependent methyltransferase [Phycisphaerae bacterium]|nr:class I SAM-dependent methyltransferase [Phycisphaerae bacterium]
MPSGSAIEEYYDTLSARFIRDCVYGNDRVRYQTAFLSSAIPRGVSSVLVVGCGAGQTPWHIARCCARKAHVLGIDISGAALQIARAIHSHPRVEYRQADILRDAVEGRWDVIVLPDVYEHIPLEDRVALHEVLSRLLSDRGRVLLTCPSPTYQAFLRERHPEKLQIVDETVTLEDLADLARDLSGALTFFNVVSVWNRNDYLHATIERGGERSGPIKAQENGPIQPLRRATGLVKTWRRCLRRSHLDKPVFWMRQWRIRRALQRLDKGESPGRGQPPAR